MQLSYEVEKLEARVREAEGIADILAFVVANNEGGKASPGAIALAREWIEGRKS